MAKIDNKVSEMKNIIPNPFSNQPNETGPTNTKRHGSIWFFYSEVAKEIVINGS